MLKFLMIKDLKFHGSLGCVDFTAHVCGPDAKSTYFYEEGPSFVRFFSRGNEFTITDGSVRYNGAGGSFCRYMFGVEKSLKDLMKKEVLNRLIMFGAFQDKAGRLIFTNETDGFEPFDRLFLQGNAVKNYYFFVSSDYRQETRRRQKELLILLGKFLKRTTLLDGENDSELMENFLRNLNEHHSTVFIFKLVHRDNEAFWKTFREAYFRDKSISKDEEFYLFEAASKLGIDYYQQERIKIDLMYGHPENKPIVDQHRDILISALEKGTLEHSEIARLRRLKTLRIRNRIPGVLFDTLDELLLKGKQIQELEYTDHLREARSIFENLFLAPQLKNNIIKEDIVRLIRAKHRAYTDADVGFEQMLLDIGKLCDETAKESGDYKLLEDLSNIITFFDRYDHVQASMSQLAFMREINLNEDFLRSIAGNKKEFDSLEDGLFQGLFVKDLLANRYITNYGRKKVVALSKGIGRIATGDASLRDIIAELRMIADEEMLYWEIHSSLKDKMGTFYPALESKEGKKELCARIGRELAARGVAMRVPEKLFEKAFVDLKKELFYLNHLLPIIIKTTDTRLREDFLANSGLDRFYVEGLEKGYFEERGLDPFLLELLKEAKDIPSGEREK